VTWSPRVPVLLRRAANEYLMKEFGNISGGEDKDPCIAKPSHSAARVKYPSTRPVKGQFDGQPNGCSLKLVEEEPLNVEMYGIVRRRCRDAFEVA